MDFNARVDGNGHTGSVLTTCFLNSISGSNHVICQHYGPLEL